MKTCNILIADDDVEDYEIIVEALFTCTSDIEVHPFRNGVEVIDYLMDNTSEPALPKLIVLDVNMPKMDGIQTLQQIKNDERFKNTPVVIYSTSINPTDHDKCLKLGANLYVTKPVSYIESIKIAKTFLSFCQA